VNRIAWRALKVGMTVSVVAAVVALTTSGGHAILLDVYLLSIGGVLLLAFVRTTRARVTTRSSDFDQALAAMRRAPVDSGEPTLVRDIELSTFTSFHLHARLRPLLREVASHRLRSRYGVELDAEAARARELVGSAAWELVRPGRPPPDDRLARGPELRELARVVEELEQI
jgi:hypothetical protein